MNNYTIYEYDIEEFPFKEVAQGMMKVDHLDQIHNVYEFPEKLEIIKDQNSVLHDLFYTEMRKPDFSELYRKFVQKFIKNLEMFEGEEILVQEFPSFRIHQPNNIAVGQFHKDSDFGHNTNEINFWLPFTDAWDTNAVWIEDPDTKELECMEVKYGQVSRFDGANTQHGNKDNKTGKSRLSIDFRIFLRKYYDHSSLEQTETLTQKKKFIIGEYWAEL